MHNFYCIGLYFILRSSNMGGGGGLTIQDPLCSASGGHAFCSTLCHCDKMTQVLAILLLPLEDCFTAE